MFSNGLWNLLYQQTTPSDRRNICETYWSQITWNYLLYVLALVTDRPCDGSVAAEQDSVGQVSGYVVRSPHRTSTAGNETTRVHPVRLWQCFSMRITLYFFFLFWCKYCVINDDGQSILSQLRLESSNYLSHFCRGKVRTDNTNLLCEVSVTLRLTSYLAGLDSS